MKTTSLNGNACRTWSFQPSFSDLHCCFIWQGIHLHKDSVGQLHADRSMQHAPFTSCLGQPKGDSPPSHNQGSGWLKLGLIVSSKPLYPTLGNPQPPQLSPSILGHTPSLLDTLMAVFLSLPAFLFWGHVLVFLATEAAAAFLQALSLDWCFLGLLGGTVLAMGFFSFCCCFLGCLLFSFSWFPQEELPTWSVFQLVAEEIRLATWGCSGKGPDIGPSKRVTAACGTARMLDARSATSDWSTEQAAI